MQWLMSHSCLELELNSVFLFFWRSSFSERANHCPGCDITIRTLNEGEKCTRIGEMMSARGNVRPTALSVSSNGVWMNAFNRYSKTFCAEAVVDEGSALHNTILVYCTSQGDIFVHNDNQMIFCCVCFVLVLWQGYACHGQLLTFFIFCDLVRSLFRYLSP